jgi:hypothetical protein
MIRKEKDNEEKEFLIGLYSKISFWLLAYFILFFTLSAVSMLLWVSSMDVQ